MTGLTLSREQQAYATERTPRQLGIQDHVAFHLRDYREDTGSYDRIVSVGMFEHVGVKHYVEFFRKVERLLKEDGIALLHTIARWDGPSVTNPWLRKYIFPGGYCPSLSEVFAALEQTGLKSLDVEMLRLHYADTLKNWSRNFEENREPVKAVYDERFCRMWEFYLAGSEAAFRHQDHMVAQIQLARRQDAAPLTRDYMVDWGARPRRLSSLDRGLRRIFTSSRAPNVIQQLARQAEVLAVNVRRLWRNVFPAILRGVRQPAFFTSRRSVGHRLDRGISTTIPNFLQSE